MGTYRGSGDSVNSGESLATADDIVAAVGWAEEWANKAVGVLVSSAAGGNGVDEYSALHHATSAAGSATAASNSETAAAASESAAAASETAAAASESAAATSETNAAASETAASGSATSAAASASAASTSETNAAASETAAATSETNAASSASSASTSATNAATSETNAATSASNAATSETNAASSATAASGSASAAATSETNAAASASAASTSETNAAASEAAAAASYDSFDDRYLGPKASAPTLDNDGDALLTGALYFDTVESAMKVYDGAAWGDAYVPSADFVAVTGDTMTGDLTVPNLITAGTVDGVDVSALDAAVAKTADSETITGSWTFNQRIRTAQLVTGAETGMSIGFAMGYTDSAPHSWGTHVSFAQNSTRGFQLSVEDDTSSNVWVRSYQDAWGSWNKFWHSGNDGAGSGLDADLLDGAQPSASAGNNTIVQRSSNGYIYANYFNTTCNDISTSTPSHLMVQQSSDGFIRKMTPANFISNQNIAKLASPAFTGTPTAPTAAAATNTTQVATTAFVQQELTSVAGFPSGTKMLFYQAAAPSGWTQDTTVNDKVLRVVSSAGGGSGGSWTISGISVDNHTLTESEIPAHTHTASTNSTGSHSHTVKSDQGSSNGTVLTTTSDYVMSSTASGFINSAGAHSHTVTVNNTGGGGGHNHGLTIGSSWRPAYINVIACSKN